MKIIERIVIKHFRSFDGGVGQPKVDIQRLKDLNVFSGANDSGKSNILRALNLFFNNEISTGTPFDISKDLSKIQKNRSNEKVESKRAKGMKDVRQKDLWVKIKIHFIKEEAGILPKKFWVEKMWDKNGLNPKRVNNIKSHTDKNKARAQEGQLTQFLSNIKFEYVPAVKDRQFFHYLFRKLQEFLFEKQDKQTGNRFKTHSSEFNKLLKSETVRLFEEFKRNTAIQAQFNIPETLIDFFRTLGVITENDISLFDRGDGIQARFIPDILNEIARGTKKKIIWGFEEPENSYEPLRCFKLAQDLLTYSDQKQIFLTSHAFPFIALKDDKVSSYRVKNTSGASQIGVINWQQRSIKGLGFGDHAEEIEKEIGILETYAKLSEHLGVAAERQRCQIFVEDDKRDIYKIAWLKYRKIPFDETNFQSLFRQEAGFEIFGRSGRHDLKKFLDLASLDDYKSQRTIGIFDFDDAFNDFNGLNAERWDSVQGTERSGLTRKRKGFDCFYAVMIPVPESRDSYAKRSFTSNHLSLEHLFEDAVLKQIGSHGGKIQPSGGLSITKIRGKSKLWKKIISLENKSFLNFFTLFQKIEKLIAA